MSSLTLLRKQSHKIFSRFAESPVPLEFTPVLGILIGVVVTLLLVAFVIMLILRLKYKTSKRNSQENRNNPSDLEDDEEYFCLKPSERPMATLQRSHNNHPSIQGSSGVGHLMGSTEHNPDIIPGMPHHHHHLNIQCAGNKKNLAVFDSLKSV